MMLQLNPPIPVVTEKGDGYAYFLKDESIDMHVIWGIVLDQGGEIWWIENPKVRVAKNWTYGRTAKPLTTEEKTFDQILTHNPIVQRMATPTPSSNSQHGGKSRGEY